MIFLFYFFGGICFLVGTLLIIVGYNGKITVDGVAVKGAWLNSLRLKFGFLGVALLIIGFYAIHL